MRLLKTAFHPEISPADISPDSLLTLIECHAVLALLGSASHAGQADQTLAILTESWSPLTVKAKGVIEFIYARYSN